MKTLTTAIPAEQSLLETLAEKKATEAILGALAPLSPEAQRRTLRRAALHFGLRTRPDLFRHLDPYLDAR